MVRKSLLTVFSLLMALLIGAAGVGAAGKTDTTPLPAANGQTSGSQTSPDAAAGSAFTYQGRLTSGGNAANGNYDLNFSLWDATSGGTQVGSTVSVANQAVTNGLFTVSLDFGATAFQGSARWLEMAVRQSGGGAYTTLTPRQPLTAAPYATSLMPGAVVTGTMGTALLALTNSGNGTGLYSQSNGPSASGVYGLNGSSGPGVVGSSVNGYGVQGTSTNGNGVYGVASNVNSAGVYGFHPSGGVGIRGENNSSANAAILGVNSGSGPSVKGQSTNGTGGYFTSTTGYGVYAVSPYGNGIYGEHTNGWSSGYGVKGYTVRGTGVYGASDDGYGVYGTSNLGWAVWGEGTNTADGGYFRADSGDGVVGYSNTTGVRGTGNTGVDGEGSTDGVYGYGGTNGVYGVSSGGHGVYGRDSYGGIGVYGNATGSVGGDGVYGASSSNAGNGVVGSASSGPSAYGVWGLSSTGYAGYFNGNVQVVGTLSKSAGSFKIDDPIDPGNKYLSHSFVESPDMMNIYNGNITTDAKGEATVTMPAWFQDLNQEFRYQLTTIGGFAPVYISQEIQGNQFEIAGGKPGSKVSWQVTGIRHDPYANAHRIPVEENKPASEQGYYLNPEVYGQPASKSLQKSRPGEQNAPTGIPTGK